MKGTGKRHGTEVIIGRSEFFGLYVLEPLNPRPLAPWAP
jgi:hypothetical protein